MKAKQREKVRPKLGKIDIDYQKLHDAFFKWQTKPRMTLHGDLYYEGKEFEIRYGIVISNLNIFLTSMTRYFDVVYLKSLGGESFGLYFDLSAFSSIPFFLGIK